MPPWLLCLVITMGHRPRAMHERLLSTRLREADPVRRLPIAAPLKSTAPAIENLEARARVVCQASPQEAPRPVQARLDRAQLDVQRLGDLRVGLRSCSG